MLTTSIILQQSDKLRQRGGQSCHEKCRYDISFSDPPTQVRNVAPWQTLPDKANQ